MLRVIVADNQPIAVKGVREIMAENFEGVTVEEAAGGQDLIDRVRSHDYDLALVGLSLPDIDGLEVLEQIKKKKPKLPVLVMSIHPQELYALRVIRAGGNGYLTKESGPEELVAAVRKVLSGKRYMSPGTAESIIFDLDSQADKTPHEKLSKREMQVACLIGKGKTIKEITEELNLSINTVRTYRVRILQKIGVKSTSQLIHYAVKHHLVE